VDRKIPQADEHWNDACLEAFKVLVLSPEKYFHPYSKYWDLKRSGNEEKFQLTDKTRTSWFVKSFNPTGCS
jgi:hypothetical protein